MPDKYLLFNSIVRTKYTLKPQKEPQKEIYPKYTKDNVILT